MTAGQRCAHALSLSILWPAVTMVTAIVLRNAHREKRNDKLAAAENSLKELLLSTSRNGSRRRTRFFNFFYNRYKFITSTYCQNAFHFAWYKLCGTECPPPFVGVGEAQGWYKYQQEGGKAVCNTDRLGVRRSTDWGWDRLRVRRSTHREWKERCVT